MDKIEESKIKAIAAENFADIIARYIPLQKRGVNKVGRCPYHDDSNPSFYVSEAKGIAKCFSCGKSVDAIAFIMDMEHCTYVEALHIIADMYGIPMDGTETAHDRTKVMQPTTTPPTKDNRLQAEIPLPFVERIRKHRGRLYNFLFGIVGTADLEQLWQDFGIGATKDGRDIFLSYDTDGRCVYGKIVNYHADGHRGHDKGDVSALHTTIIKYMQKHHLWTAKNTPIFAPTLFGAHQLEDYPQNDIAIVESEKSALIATLMFHDYLWCAVGGKSYLNARMIDCCKGRRIFVFPDIDGMGEWTDKTKQLQQSGFNIHVVDWAKGLQVDEKSDIADIILKELHPIEKFLATEYGWRLPQLPIVEHVKSILEQMEDNNPAVASLVDSLRLVKVDEALLSPLTPMQQTLSGVRYSVYKQSTIY